MFNINNKAKLLKYIFFAGRVVLQFLILLFFISSCGNTTIRRTNQGLRVVSLVPSLTQSIDYLGANSVIVGCTNYCLISKENDSIVVGSVTKPNIEKIVSLKPDVVLASGLVPNRDIEAIKRFGINVEIFTSPQSFEEICEQFIKLGKLVGKEQEALKTVSQAQFTIKNIYEAQSYKPNKPRIFMQIGASPIYTVIPNTFMNDYITYCGGLNIAGNLTNGTIGREFVISHDPDYIFIVTMGIIGEEELRKWQQFTKMKAVIHDNIYILNSDVACQPTPMTFIEILELINQIITKSDEN